MWHQAIGGVLHLIHSCRCVSRYQIICLLGQRHAHGGSPLDLNDSKVHGPPNKDRNNYVGKVG